MDDNTSIEALTERVAMLEALVEKLTTQTLAPVPAPYEASAESGEDVPTPSTPGGPLPRRQMLGRAGMAAVGAVLGGTVAAVGTASPAAAATGTFDTSTSDPALTATSGGTGHAISSTATQPGGTAIQATASAASGYALRTTGRTDLTGETTIDVDFTSGVNISNALNIRARGADAGGISMKSDGNGALLLAGKLALWAYGGTIGVQATGDTAQIRLANSPVEKVMPPPRTRSDAHLNGELYFDDSGELWLCVADGTPGTWVRLGGPGTTGAFTVLHSPVRVYDTRPNSGKPGANTGPVAGIRHDIDLTANKSGLPLDATAAVVNLAVTDTTPKPTAYAQIYANDLTTPPLPKTITWTGTNQAITSTTTTAITAGKVTIRTSPSANILIDVIGYHR